MPATVIIEPNYKVTVPKKTREAFDLHIGEEVQVTFIPKKQVKEEMATPQEIRAIKNGRNAHARGEYISITGYIRGVETSPHKTRAKKSAKNK